MHMKKIAIICLATLIFNSLAVYGAEEKSGCQKQNFVVTAYYSPTPGQKMYIRWNYQNDVVLNWRWTNWADWSEVYMWMLAWPSSYSFGTKVILPWLWIGTIHDRWWAIVAKSSYHRIDVWMWKWEVWLARALNWWLRFIEWQTCPKSSWLADTLDYTVIPSTLPASIEQRLIARSSNSFTNQGTYVKSFKKATIDNFKFVHLPSNLWEWDSWDEVIKLQMILQNLWYYTPTLLTWIYDVNTMEAVFQFQRENLVISNSIDQGAWTFGPKTKQALDKYLIDLSGSLKQVSISKLWEILIWSKKEELAKTVIPSWITWSKSEIYSLDDSFSVANVQRNLREKISSPSSIIAWWNWNKISLTKQDTIH